MTKMHNIYPCRQDCSLCLTNVDLVYREPDKADQLEPGPEPVGVPAHRDRQSGQSRRALSQGEQGGPSTLRYRYII